jgi:hypothetical protein
MIKGLNSLLPGGYPQRIPYVSDVNSQSIMLVIPFPNIFSVGLLYKHQQSDVRWIHAGIVKLLAAWELTARSFG